LLAFIKQTKTGRKRATTPKNPFPSKVYSKRFFPAFQKE
jgi:hypothetical protein